MKKYLGIVGISGSGKTTLMHQLIKNYPSLFFKINQCTTRDIRDDEVGDAYVWLDSKRDYDKLKHLLIAKTEINGKYYGSIPEEREDKIGILILNEKGLLDLLNNPPLDRKQYYIVGIDKTEVNVYREGRDENYLNKEKEVLKYCDVVFTVGKNEWTNPERVMQEVTSFFNEEIL